MGIKELTKTSEKHLVDFNYVDAAAGITYLKYYVGAIKNASGTITYVLKPFSFHGSELKASSNGTGTGVRIDKTFTYDVLRNIIVDGNALVSFEIFMYKYGWSGNSSTYDLDVKIIKNTTTLATFTRSNIGGTFVIGSGSYYENVNAILDLPKTVFKRGDTLKLEVIFTSNSGDVLMELTIFYDPDSVSVTIDSIANTHTEMILYLPVVPEL